MFLRNNRVLHNRKPECDWCFVPMYTVIGKDYNDYYKCPSCGYSHPVPQPDFDEYETPPDFFD